MLSEHVLNIDWCGCVTFTELLLVADIHYWRTQENVHSKLNTKFMYIESDMTFEKILVIFLSILLNVLCGKLWGSLVFIVSLELVLHKSLENIFVTYIMLYDNSQCLWDILWQGILIDEKVFMFAKNCHDTYNVAI